MTVALLVMTDGRRDCIERTVASARDNLIGLGSVRVIHDDSGDPDFAAWLRSEFSDFVVVSALGRSGFGGAIQSAWSVMLEASIFSFVFHLEDDFTFNRPVDLAAMETVLDERSQLAQMALRRQPWNNAERAAGGVVEADPGAFVEFGQRTQWLEHRAFFTTNPCLYRRRLMTVGWPDGERSEGVFTHRLLAEGLPWGVPGDEVRFGYWGARDSGEAVHHIGDQRVGVGY